jgi:fructose-1,6-bisphosphatase I
MLKGGVFLYPSTTSNPNGKLRLMYECNPFAYLIEMAGGKATDGGYRDVMDIAPIHIHERCPIVIGSSHMMADFERFLPISITNEFSQQKMM